MQSTTCISEKISGKIVDNVVQKTVEQRVMFSCQLMAAMRARETDRSDRLFSDPLAAALAGPALRALEELNQKGYEIVSDTVSVRTRFFDDFLIRVTSAAEASGIKQVVLLAAGMDTRAFRLKFSEQTQFFELDQRPVFDRKETLLGMLTPTCGRRAIATDLTAKGWLAQLMEAGYDAQQHSVWLLEGLLMYLNEAQVRELLTAVESAMAPGSWLGADILNKAMMRRQDTASPFWQSGFDEPEELFNTDIWQAKVSQLGEAGINFGRLPETLPRSAGEFNRVFLIEAQKV